MMLALRRLWHRFFPPPPPPDPLEAWVTAYGQWLDVATAIFADFPDHASLEGAKLSAKEKKLLAEIARLWGDDSVMLFTGFTVRKLRIDRMLAERKGLPLDPLLQDVPPEPDDEEP